MKNILAKNIPLWLSLVFLAVFAAAGFFVFQFYRQTIYNYDILAPLADGGRQEFKYGSWPALANADFFQKVKKSFIEQSTNFIEADLSAMKLSVYQDGRPVLEVPILTKGREGSWWETPAGLYKAGGKSRNSYSTFGHVYMPFSISFHGNFLIHGWPYYSNGEPVPQGYSGGCIRLSTEDAAKVFDFVDIGMPVLVFEKDFAADNFAYLSKKPDLSSQSYLAADLKNNFVFFENEKEERRPIASLAKLTAALTAIEHINIEKEIFVIDSMLIETSKPRLKVGDVYSVYDLLYPLLMESSNEAAESLAYYFGRERFIREMNNRAFSLGMANTIFADSFGGSEENVSTPEDLFQLAKYLYNNRHFILDISRGEAENSLLGRPKLSNLDNFNILIEEPGFIGGKVGLTEEAGQTFLMIYEMEFAGQKRPIVFIGLHSQDSAADLQKMIDYVKENYQ